VEAAEIERRLDRLRTAFRRSGAKLTHQRLEIFREIASRVDHPGVDAVFHAVKNRLPTVSLDTVYRTLWLLNDLRLITTLGPRREGVRFDPNLDRHHHYVCVQCGLVQDFESPRLAALHVPAAVHGFGSIEGVQVEVRGLCRRCASERAGGRKKERIP
jgi:Fur family peroxide stress response transcriptional regulator